MVSSINDRLGIVYGYSLVFGLLLSVYTIFYFREEYKDLNFNLKVIPVWVFLLCSLLFIFYIYFVPLLFIRFLNHPDLISKFSSILGVQYMAPSGFRTVNELSINNENRVGMSPDWGNAQKSVTSQVEVDGSVSEREVVTSSTKTLAADGTLTSVVNKGEIVVKNDVQFGSKANTDRMQSENGSLKSEKENKTALAELKTDTLKISKDKKLS